MKIGQVSFGNNFEITLRVRSIALKKNIEKLGKLIGIRASSIQKVKLL